MLHDPLALLAATGIGLIVVTAAAAPLVAPYAPDALDPTHAFASPSWAHWFGTDELGRDLLSRILYGGRYSLGIGIGATLIAAFLGLVWGLGAALSRRFVDDVLMRLADATMAVPQILLALIFVAAVGADGVKLAIIIGLLLTPVTARMVRSVVLAEVELEYYSAAVAYGASRTRLILRELMPNIVVPVGVQATVNLITAILTEAALSFVGLGIQPPAASWGTLLQTGYQDIYQSIWYVVFPGLAICLTAWLLTILADRAADVFDPRRRRA